MAASPSDISGTPPKLLINFTIVLMIVTFPHVVEDFHYGDLLGFEASPALAVLALALVYLTQVVGITLVARGDWRGSLLLAVAGAIWCIGALAIHGRDLMFAGPDYRHGLASKLVEAAIVGLGALVAIVGARSLWPPRNKVRHMAN